MGRGLAHGRDNLTQTPIFTKISSETVNGYVCVASVRPFQPLPGHSRQSPVGPAEDRQERCISRCDGRTSPDEQEGDLPDIHVVVSPWLSASPLSSPPIFPPNKARNQLAAPFAAWFNK